MDFYLLLDHQYIAILPSVSFLMQRCLQYEPAKRISAKDAMIHPYFDDLDKSQV
jgi:serine/threonine protein kinase